MDLHGHVRAAEGGDELDGAEWNVEEDGLEGVKAKGLDDERPKCGDAAGGNTAIQSKGRLTGVG